MHIARLPRGNIALDHTDERNLSALKDLDRDKGGDRLSVRGSKLVLSTSIGAPFELGEAGDPVENMAP